MKTNMGKFDRLFRILIAVAIAVLYSLSIITGTVAIILLVIAAAFAITSLVGFCPLYLPFGFSTRRKKGPNAA
jgi:hypothetical protein